MSGVIAGLLQAAGLLSVVVGGLFLMVRSSNTNGFNAALPVLIAALLSALLFFGLGEIVNILDESRTYHRRSMVALEQLLKLRQAEMASSRPLRQPRPRRGSESSAFDELDAGT